MASKTKFIGVDAGNGQLKQRTLDGKNYLYPSAYINVADVAEILAEHQEWMDENKIRVIDERFVLATADLPMLSTYAIDTKGSDFTRYSTNSFQNLFMMGIKENVYSSYEDPQELAGKTVGFVVATGLPNDNLYDPRNSNIVDGIDLHNGAFQFALGKHTANVNGVKFTINVQDVTTIPETLGGYYSYMATLSSKADKMALAAANVAMWNGGTGNSQRANVVNGTYMKNIRNSQDNNGSNVLIDNIYNRLLEQEPALRKSTNLNTVKLLNMLSNGERQIKFGFPVQTIDATDIFDEEINKYGEMQVNLFNASGIDFDRVQVVLLTGGMAPLFSEKQFGGHGATVIRLENSVYANVNGYVLAAKQRYN